MTNKLHTMLGGIALATAMAASAPAFAEVGDFSVWDKDNSGVITMGEWDTGFDNDALFTSWDSDKDGMLSNNGTDKVSTTPMTPTIAAIGTRRNTTPSMTTRAMVAGWISDVSALHP